MDSNSMNKTLPKIGDRVICVDMKDPHAVDPGIEGTVEFVDDIKQIHVNWDNGRSLALIPDEDQFIIIENKSDHVKNFKNFTE